MSDTLDSVNISGLSALIVDDSAPFCAAARRVLEAGGTSVVGTASTSAAAVAQARDLRPDLILVDIDLGGENGFDVVEALEAVGLQPAPAVIMVSTHDEEDFADLVESSSALGFLQKFDLSAEAIEAILTSSHPGR